MTYELYAIIGPQELLEAHATDYKLIDVVPLTAGLALIPLTEDLSIEIGEDETVQPFLSLTASGTDWLRRLSADGSVAYVEADFWGGDKKLCATVWCRGEETLAPVDEPEAINRALRMLGVDRTGHRDEFEAVGLQNYHHSEDRVGQSKDEDDE